MFGVGIGDNELVSNVPAKRIVCLANSRKMSGRCIAGKEILPDGSVGEWIRPVSDRENEEVSEYERQYPDGSDPRVLDVIDVPLRQANPKNYQTENWLLDPDRYWVKIRTATAADLDQLLDPVESLWINGVSSLRGRNDRVSTETASRLSNSLRIIKIDSMDLVVSQPGMDFGNTRRSLQGRFWHDSVEYWLRVTDPIYERRYLQLDNGTYPIGAAFLTVSLGEPYQGYSYKPIAAIITD